MFNKINSALNDLASRGTVIKTFSNGNQLIDADKLFRNYRLIGLGKNVVLSVILVGVGALARAAGNR